MNIKSTIDYFSRQPRTLSLMDGFGTAWTTFALFFCSDPNVILLFTKELYPIFDQQLI